MEIEIGVTYNCNWECSYCCVDTHEQPIKSFDQVRKEIGAVPNWSDVTISGGEPGMLNNIQIQYIIDRLKQKNCTIDLLTNGLFIKKYPELLKYFSKIDYHCMQDLDGEIEFLNIDHSNVTYVLVVQFSDFNDKLLRTIRRYPEIDFRIQPNITRHKDPIQFRFLNFMAQYKYLVHEDTMTEHLKNML